MTIRFMSFPVEGIAYCLAPCVVLLCLAPHAGPGAPVFTPSVAERGLVVEEVGKGSEGERSGLQAEDVLLTWSRGEAQGNLNSPFDLGKVELEQAPRGAVTLRGRRGSQKLSWVLGPTEWGIRSRPVLPPPLLAAYEEGRDLAKAGKAADAALRWSAAIAQIRKAQSAERAAWLLSRAAEAYAQAEQWEKADEMYRMAAEQAAPGVSKAHLLYRWASTLQLQNKWAEAAKYYQESIAEGRKGTASNLAVAHSLRELGRVYEARGDLLRADESYTHARQIFVKLARETLELAINLHDLADVTARTGDLAKAEECYRHVLAIYDRFMPGSYVLARTLQRLGDTVDARGDLAKAEAYYTQSLPLARKVAPESLFIQALQRLGVLLRERGDVARAEEYSEQALSMTQKVMPESLDVALCLHSLGLVAHDRGGLEEAEEYYKRALAIQEKVGATPRSLDVAGMILHALGRVARERGDLGKAEEHYRRALALAESRIRRGLAPFESPASGNRPVGFYLAALARLAVDRGDLAKAEDYYRQGLTIQEKFAPGSLDVAATLHGLAEVAGRRGDPAKAEAFYGQALLIREKLSPGSILHAESLHALGFLLRAQGRINEAGPLIRKALDALENQTGRLGGDEEQRAGFRARYVGYYRDYLDLLLDQKQPESAFHVLERSRGRSLLALLAERDLLFSSDLPVEIRQARQYNAAAYDRVQAQIAPLNPTTDAARIEELLARLRHLKAERGRIAEQVKRASPRLAALQYPEPLDVARTRQVLDSGTVLLSYSVGVDDTVLFVVQPAPKERALEVFRVPIGEKALRQQVEEFRALIQQRGGAAHPDFVRSARALYDLLIRPAEAQLETAERMLLIPDGSLHVLPFAALMRDEKHYLVQWKPPHMAVSATVYAELMKMRQAERNTAVDLVAFGDPRYRNFDSQQAPRPADREVRRALELGLPLARLPYSRDEVQSLAALHPGRSQIYLDTEATEERAKSLSQTGRYIHFATHGLLDERLPLNSALVLTLPQQVTDGQENGLLQAWEIFEQVRWDADLVVLSACETGLGKELSGEGLVGLTRALYYAGARSVLASLWSVEDKRTSRLMTLFYRHLKSGKSKDEALRAAQLELIQSPAGARPVHWAAFALNGDWR